MVDGAEGVEVLEGKEVRGRPNSSQWLEWHRDFVTGRAPVAPFLHSSTSASRKTKVLDQHA